MAETTGIAWCDSTFNPWAGCTKVGPGCDHCYAEVSTPSRTLGLVWGPGQPRHRTGVQNWNLPRRWERNHEAFMAKHGHRQRVFCASLADVFDNEAPDEWRTDLWALIRETPHLDWQILTKRISNAKRMLPDDWGGGYKHVWLGISVVDQTEANRDVPKLQDTPAALRWLSMEPLLGPTTLVLERQGDKWDENSWTYADYPLKGKRSSKQGQWDVPPLDWVVVGGESGDGFRAMDPEWARNIKWECNKAGVPFLMKQMSGPRGSAEIADVPADLQQHQWPASPAAPQ